MKTLLLILLISGTGYCATTFDEVLDGIHWVESRRGANTNHADGVSKGAYGVTEIARRELVTRKLIPSNTTLLTKAGNKLTAQAYLLYCYKKTGSLWGACKMYHGSTNHTENERYAKDVWAEIDRQRKRGNNAEK